MARIERTVDGRWYIRTAAGNVARQSNGEPWHTRDKARAEASLAYLAMGYEERRRAAHWLKSTWGVEG